MLQEVQMNAFLGRYRFWMTAFILFAGAVWAVWAYNSACLVFDTCTKRADQGSIEYWLIWGNAFGLLSIAFAYWCMWHVTFGIYFWIGFLFALIFMLWHGVCGIWYISWQIDCGGIAPCFGCTDRSPTDADVDPLWIVNWVLVWFLAAINFAFMWILGTLRSRTEFGLFWWMASETRTNGNIATMPNPLTPWASPPGAPGAAQSPSHHFQMFLARFRFLATIISFLHLCCMAVIAWNFGNLLMDVCAHRAFSWDYLRLYGVVIGIVGLFAGYWILWHLIFGFWYITAFVLCLLSAAWHFIEFIFIIIDNSNCTSTSWCSGCSASSTPEWPFILYWALLGTMFLCNIAYLVLIVILRQHADWQVYIEAAMSPNDQTQAQIIRPSTMGSNLPAWLGGYGYPGVSSGSPMYVQVAQNNINSKLIGAEYDPLLRQLSSTNPNNMVVSSSALIGMNMPGAGVRRRPEAKDL